MSANDYMIDKSRFNAEQLAQFEELIGIGKVEKAAVDPEAAQEEMKDDVPSTPSKKPAKKAEVETMEDTKKSAAAAPSAAPEVPDFVKNAIAKSEEFMTRIEKQEMTEIAKKYSILGEKPEELGEKLYNLKKSDEAMYNTCISMLDGQVALIEKSGLFNEIGKSDRGLSTAGGAVAKAEAKAQEIRKADPNMTYEAAIAKAWEDPELMDEYDAEYRRY